VGDAVDQRTERPAVVEIRDVDDVPGSAQLVGERLHPGGQALGVMEQENLGHEHRRVAVAALGDLSS
jgi:hypothetical protein